MTTAYKRLLLLLLPVSLIIGSCSGPPEAGPIIDKAIETHGGDAYNNSHIAFTFREVEYTVRRQNGRFVLTRTFPDSLGGITDSLTNKGFTRTVAGRPVALSADEDSMYSNSVNAVIYFALLPYKLNDAAVNKKYLGKTTINGEPYYEIEVTFDQQGGGTDHQDRYIYWIHRDKYTMDYMAYRFQTDGGGTRFRQAKNMRKVDGILFADYNNFGSPEMQHPLENYERYFQSDTLSKVSEINLHQIRVKQLKNDE